MEISHGKIFKINGETYVVMVSFPDSGFVAPEEKSIILLNFFERFSRVSSLPKNWPKKISENENFLEISSKFYLRFFAIWPWKSILLQLQIYFHWHHIFHYINKQPKKFLSKIFFPPKFFSCHQFFYDVLRFFFFLTNSVKNFPAKN